jgi:GrpB-like predicted nucleotidyltransferase (UPF0157 family)
MQRQAPVKVVAYDSSWPDLFRTEERYLSQALAEWLVEDIQHVGSTAVPGLAAKPVIDLMAPVESLDASRPAIDFLVQSGYAYFPYKTEVMHWFCKPSAAHRTHHLHLVPFGSSLWHDRLAFRDALRGSSELAAKYAALKQALAAKYELEREAYTEAKGPFVDRVLSQLRGDRGAT